MRFFMAAACLASLLGCGVAESVAPSADDSRSVDAALSLRASTSIQFRNDWSVSTGAALVVGGEARIEYDARRVTKCLGDFNGHPGWTVTAHYAINGGPPKLLTVAGFFPGGSTPAVIPLAEAGTLELWFETTNRWGCQEWDSSYGNNYRFEIFAPTIIHFELDGRHWVEGSLKGARAVALSYPLERLPNCRQTYSGLPSWEIVAYAQFNDVPLKSTPVTRFSGSTRVASLGAFEVPALARTLEVWFLNSDRAGCMEWDSVWGQNYRFELQQN